MSKILNLVKRTVYKRLKQEEIGAYVDKLLEKGQGPEFEPFQTILSDLGKKKTDYLSALAKTGTGGRPATIVKDEAKLLLMQQLDLYANAIDSAAITNPLIIPLSGFENKTSNTTKPQKETLPPPTLITFTPNNKIPGQGIVEIQVEDKKRSWNFSIDWALEDNVWHPTLGGSSLRIVIDNLPSGKLVKVRVRINAGNGNSGYTESNFAYIV